MRRHHHRFIPALAFILAAVTASAGATATAQVTTPVRAETEERQGNVWGINLGWEPGWSTVATVRLLGLAQSLVGDWGYIRHGVSPDPDVAATRRSMAMVRAHRLIPISGGAYPDPEFRIEGTAFPRLEADGTTRNAARARARVWRLMYDAGIPFYAVEVMNEVNMGNAFPPEHYAQWLYDYAVESKKAYPGLKICSCGMAGSGADYYDAMLTFKPALRDVVDFWGCHPYGANHPPEKEPAETTLRSYELTAAVLKKHGVDPIRIMATETGYELEIGDVGKNPAYPPIREDNRAEYMARAFRDYYEPDQRLEVVAPFMLWDLVWHNWDGWDYMNHDGTPKPIYYASMREPKPPGRDWMPTGDGVIAGRITWRDTDIGIPRVVVSTEPGLYGAVTDDTGHYEIRDLPEGQYHIHLLADGYAPGPPGAAIVRDQRAARYSARMNRATLVPHHFGQPGQPAAPVPPMSWDPLDVSADGVEWRVDPQVRFRDRIPSLRFDLAANRRASLFNYGQYYTAYPNEMYLAEVYVRARVPRAHRDAPGRPWLEIAASSGRGEILSAARASATDFKADGRWHRITAAILGPARTARVRLALGVDDGPGTFWFSAPFVGEADFPLPTDEEYRTTGYVPPLYEQNRELFPQAVIDVAERNPSLQTATITGQVTDFRDRPIRRATIATEAPVFVAVSDEDGRYTLTVPADVPLRVRAFSQGVEMAISDPIELEGGERAAVDLVCDALPAPAELVNSGFNRYTPNEPGLMEGWTSFGTTDGITASGGMIFEVPSYEGEGLYFAQSGSNVKNGGAFQVVQAEPGARYRLTGRVYTRTEGDGKRPLDNNCRLGIDPTGGQDPDSPDVVWTDPTESEQAWTLISVETIAKAGRITVFLRHEMRRANVWNLTLFDDLRLERVD